MEYKNIVEAVRWVEDYGGHRKVDATPLFMEQQVRQELTERLIIDIVKHDDGNIYLVNGMDAVQTGGTDIEIINDVFELFDNYNTAI